MQPVAVKIEGGIGPEPIRCVTCGADESELLVATDPADRVEPTRRNPRPVVKLIGYDCASCGAQMRFGFKEAKE